MNNQWEFNIILERVYQPNAYIRTNSNIPNNFSLHFPGLQIKLLHKKTLNHIE